MAQPSEEVTDLLVAHAPEHGGVGDLVAVEMQDRQHRAVMRGIQKLVRMPGRRERPGFGFAVTDDAGDNQVGIVERGAIGMDQRVAEARRLHGSSPASQAPRGSECHRGRRTA